MTNNEKIDYDKSIKIIDEFVNLLSKQENNEWITHAMRRIYVATKKNREQSSNNSNISDIQEVKNIEMIEINDFCETIREYGHIYHYPVEKLDVPFKKIMEGIEEIQEMMNDSWSM